jgi:hypothetical protein
MDSRFIFEKDYLMKKILLIALWAGYAFSQAAELQKPETLHGSDSAAPDHAVRADSSGQAALSPSQDSTVFLGADTAKKGFAKLNIGSQPARPV